MTTKTLDKIGAITLILRQGGTLADVQEALRSPQTRQEAVKEREVPAPVVLTDEAKAALKRLPTVFAEVQPEEIRRLTDKELKQVWDEYSTLKVINDLLGGRFEDVKEIVRLHMDETAVAEKRVNKSTPLDANGHYVLAAPQNPERANVPDTNMAFSREYRSGKLTLDFAMVERMYDQGEISRDAYLAMTSERRIFDQDKTLKNLVHAPNEVREEIITVIEAMTEVGRPSTALYPRKAK